jgi:hypothetical protein
MKKFYLGYVNPEDTELTEFSTASEASYRSEEWVTVEAETLEDAKARYEETFIQWQTKMPLFLKERNFKVSFECFVFGSEYGKGEFENPYILGINGIDFEHKPDGGLVATVRLQHPGLLIGKGGRMIEKCLKYCQNGGYKTEILIKESRTFDLGTPRGSYSRRG